MTPENPKDLLPQAVVRARRGIPIVWIIPLTAALVGGWLWYQAVQERGPVITISFETADGLEVDKTQLKYKDLEIGTVTDVRLGSSLDRVYVTAELHAGSESYLVENTRFWVVRPRIGAGGISGLSTIVSGAYIAVDISTKGVPTSYFTGLEDPPSRSTDSEGLRIKLRSQALGSIGVGTPVTHLNIRMGDVEGYRFLREEELIEFDVYIEPQFASLVRRNTRFWNSSGMELSLAAGGFEVHIESVEALLLGGIAFGKPIGESPGPEAEDGDLFRLIPKKSDAQLSSSEPKRAVAYFHEPVRGLSVGSPVEFLGIEIGRVLSVGIEVTSDTVTFRMPVVFETYADRLRLGWMEGDDPSEVDRVAHLVKLGLRAQLGPPSLITGARNLLLDFNPKSDSTMVGGNSELPEVPTIPSAGETLNDLIAELPKIVADLRDSVAGISALVNSDDVSESLASVRSATASLDALLTKLSPADGPLFATLGSVSELTTDLDALVREVKADTPELLATLQSAADAALGLVQSGEQGVGSLADGMPVLQAELSAALREIASGMRSIAGLADYLERHPEALLKGKSSQ